MASTSNVGRPRRAYTLAQLCEALDLPVSSYYDLKRAGKLPFVEELKPRIGKRLRFRADLIDLYLAGEWQRSHVTQSRTRPTSTVIPEMGAIR